MNIVTLNPPLHSGVRRGKTTGIILHHTAGGTAVSTIDYLRKLAAQGKPYSYHYMIDRDGTITKCVPVTRRANHAGESRGKYGNDVNSQTIGIGLCNMGTGEAYPKAQIDACVELCNALDLVMNLDWISTHRLITKRKIDPAHFDFLAFCARVPGLTRWMDASLGRQWSG